MTMNVFSRLAMMALAAVAFAGCEQKDKNKPAPDQGDNSNLYVEPVCVWSDKQSNILSRYGEPDETDVNEAGYPWWGYNVVDAGAALFYIYFFESATGPVFGVTAGVAASESKMRSFLSGKYTDYHFSEGNIMAAYGNSSDYSRATKLVYLRQVDGEDNAFEALYINPASPVFDTDGNGVAQRLSRALQVLRGAE
jgi:hypothetical protein